MSTRTVSDRLVVAAEPAEVFDLLANPRRHAEIDGSGTVKGAVRGPNRLYKGAEFGMRMQIGVPYFIKNTVVEFEENKRIGWRHFARHIWRYELEPVDGGTRVTETWHDDRRWPKPLADMFDRIATRGHVFADFQRRNIATTLANLKTVLESADR